MRSITIERKVTKDAKIEHSRRFICLSMNWNNATEM